MKIFYKININYDKNANLMCGRLKGHFSFIMFWRYINVFRSVRKPSVT